MFKHFLKISWRNIWRNKLFSFINVFGLSVALAFCVLIYFYVKEETSYDSFDTQGNHLFLLITHDYTDPTEHKYVTLPTAYGTTLQQEVPSVQYAIRYNDDGVIVKNGDKVFSETANFTDADFFRAFSFPLLEGNPSTALSGLNDVVLTPAMAKKYFGNEDPLGKTLTITANDKENYIVTAIAQTPPDNSSISFKLLLRDEKISYYDMMNRNWRGFNTPTFVRLRDDASLPVFQKQLDAFNDKYLAAAKKAWAEGKKVPADSKILQVTPLPLSQLHFADDVKWSNATNSKYIFILSGIALLILIIACINYISLALSSASGRISEMGVRKVVGAERAQLIRQLWGESLMLGVIALVLSIVLVKLFLPVFNELTQKNFSLNLSEFAQATVFLILLLALVSFITGAYPAFFLSSFQPAKVLKGRNTYHFKSGLIRGLVVVQYTLSAFLIVSALVMYRQMKFVSSKDLGYDKNQMLVIPLYASSNEGAALANRFKDQLRNQPGIVSVSSTSEAPSGRGWDIESFKVNDETRNAFVYRIDYDFIPAMGIQMDRGRNFSPNFPSDTASGIVVNEALVQEMGWTDPVGQSLAWMEGAPPARVIGVVKDFNFLSLENKISPMLFYMKNAGDIRTLLVRISPNNIPQTITQLQKTWNAVNPGKPFEYTFQDDNVSKQYAQYQRWMTIMLIATVMAILIASLGLFGLTGIMTVNKTKEIGIRKVFGASVNNILFLLNKGIVKLSVISFLIAMPVSWYMMNQWLQNFAFRIPITLDIPFIAIAFAMIISLFTVSYHTLRAAIANPVKSLRSE